MKFRPLLIIQLFIFLIPLFFLPVTRDFIDYNKNMLLFGLSMAALIVYAAKSVKERKLTLHIDQMHYAVLALVASYVVSLIVMSPNKIEAFLQPGGVSTIISLAILYFIVPQLTPIKSTRDVLIPLVASAALVAVYSIANMFGLLNTLPLPAILKNPNVAAAIVLPQSPKDTPRGIQLKGTAKVLDDQKDVDKAIAVYKYRIFPMETIEKFMKDPEFPHKFYKIKPSQIVLFDGVNFPEKWRQELNL